MYDYEMADIDMFKPTEEQYKIALKNGISRVNVYNRINNCGWEIEEAITKPIRKPNEDYLKYAKIAEKNGVTYHTFMTRVSVLNWEPELAATTKKQTSKEVAMKRRKKIPLEVEKEALKNGISRITLYFRIYKYGWDMERAMTTPPIKTKANRKSLDEIGGR